VRSAVLDAIGRLRTLAIAIDPASEDWIGVYDERTEKQDGSHEALAQQISQALHTAAVAVLVHDSDVVAMKGFRDGVEKASYCNKPGYFEGKEDVASIEGESFWVSLLRDRSDSAALIQAFKSEDVFAEETLSVLAQLFGWSEPLSRVGYNSLDEVQTMDEGIDVLVLAEERVEESMTPAAKGSASPRVDLTHGVNPITDESLRANRSDPSVVLQPNWGTVVAIFAASRGVAAKGVRTSVWGPALDDGLVRLDRVEIKPAVNGPTVSGRPESEGSFLVAAFPEVEIRDGSQTVPVAQFTSLSAQETQKVQAADLAASFEVHLALTALRLGEARLFLEVAPLTHPEGAARGEVSVGVRARDSFPLRFQAHHRAQDLARLQGTRQLYGLVVFKGESNVKEFVLDAVMRWRPFAFRDDDLVLVMGVPVETMGPKGKPKATGRGTSVLTQRRRARDLFAGTEGEVLRAALSRGSYVIIQKTPDDPGSIAAGRDVIAAVSESKSDPTVTTLLLTMDARSPQNSDGFRLLHELLEAALAAKLIHQAVLGRSLEAKTQILPYEQLCGLDGAPTGRKGWVTRWLRGVSADGFALGPELLAQLGSGVEHLRAVAEVTPIGDGVRVIPRIGGTLRAVEKTLAAILPTQEDASKAREAIEAHLLKMTGIRID
jgi:hypothetical protein